MIFLDVSWFLYKYLEDPFLEKTLESIPRSYKISKDSVRVYSSRIVRITKNIFQLQGSKKVLRLAQGKKSFRATCPKGKLEFKFFFF